MFLYCIVCQVYKFVVKAFHVELLRSSSNVTILEPITFLMSIYTCKTDITPNVKFSFLIKERHNILLNNVSSQSSLCINFFSLYFLFDLLDTFHYLNSITSIGILPRLHQPGISFLGLKSIFKLLIFLFFLLLPNRLVSSCILFRKAHKIFIIYFCYVKSHRYEIKGINVLCFIIAF